MSQLPKTRTDKLVDLAKEIDGAGVKISASDADLDQRDRFEIERVQNALLFLQDVKHEIDQKAEETLSVDTVKLHADFTHGEGGSLASDSLPESSKKIGPYSVIRLLGQGGFAKVFLAHDEKLDRSVALKVLKPSAFFSKEASARFKREARAAAILNHPNIVPVFETGTVGTDHFIASAYFEAESMDQWLESQARSIEPVAAARIIATLADATEHAHQRGVIHRDLKPANVLIQVQANGEFQLRITDFGLAKHIEANDQLRTTEGAIVGTPAYMSPEQAQGTAEISGATDIYSLGVILYELLTGELPILGETHIDTLLAIRSHEPTPLSRKLPADLRAICLKCLRKSPAKRYSSAFELADDLRRWLAGLTVRARKVSRAERIKKWCARNPALAIALVGMAAGLIFSLVQWNLADAHWKRSLAETERAQKEAIRAQRGIDLNQATIKQLVIELANSPKIQNELRSELIGMAASAQKKLLAEDPENEKVILQLCGINFQYAASLVEVGKFHEAISICDEALQFVEPLMVNENPPLHLRNLLRGRKATCLTAIGEHQKAIAILAENVEQSADDLQLANDLRIAGATKLRDGDENGAYVDLQKSRLLFESLGQDNPFVIAESVFLYVSLAKLELKFGNALEAEELLETALRNQEKVESFVSHGDSVGQLGLIKLNLGHAKTKLEKYKEAEQLLDDAISRMRALQLTNTGSVSIQDKLLRSHNYRVALELARKDWQMASRVLDSYGADYCQMPDSSSRKSFGPNLAYYQYVVATEMHRREVPGFAQRLEAAIECIEFLESQYPENNDYRQKRTSLADLAN